MAQSEWFPVSLAFFVRFPAYSHGGAPLTIMVDPEVPIDISSGKVYHLNCRAEDLADYILLVGDPGRVPFVAEFFDAGSVSFDGMSREIRIITGTFHGVRVSCLSTGMGTDNVEIVINEIHVLKEYDLKKQRWLAAEEKPKVVLIRVGTCGTPRDVPVGTFAVTRHCIGLDNTCQYYNSNADVENHEICALKKAINETDLGKIGVYATMAHPTITAALQKSVATHAPTRRTLVGITGSASGFYACQGRAVGRFAPHMRFPNLLRTLRSFELPIRGEPNEPFANLEMETSALCFLSNILGYYAGTMCVIIAKRTEEHREFMPHDDVRPAMADAIRCSLEALISI